GTQAGAAGAGGCGRRRLGGMTKGRVWTLLGPDGRSWRSPQPGTLGGHRGSRIYGRLDCRAAIRMIAKGGYVSHRVFFLDAIHARAAGYRPCAVCMPEEYAPWKGRREE